MRFPWLTRLWRKPSHQALLLKDLTKYREGYQHISAEYEALFEQLGSERERAADLERRLAERVAAHSEVLKGKKALYALCKKHGIHERDIHAALGIPFIEGLYDEEPK